MKINRNGEGVLFLCDEDLEFTLDIDPKTVSDKEWADILDYMRNYYNDDFSMVLAQAVEYVLARGDKKEDV